MDITIVFMGCINKFIIMGPHVVGSLTKTTREWMGLWPTIQVQEGRFVVG